MTSSSRRVSPMVLAPAKPELAGPRSVSTRSETMSRLTQNSPAITVRMLLKSIREADCFGTTSWAPNNRASMISDFSTEAVNRMVRSGAVCFERRRKTSRPVSRGIEISRRRTSGWSSLTRSRASLPFVASPTTVNPPSASRSFRTPSRKME